MCLVHTQWGFAFSNSTPAVFVVLLLVFTVPFLGCPSDSGRDFEAGACRETATAAPSRLAAEFNRLSPGHGVAQAMDQASGSNWRGLGLFRV